MQAPIFRVPLSSLRCGIVWQTVVLTHFAFYLRRGSQLATEYDMSTLQAQAPLLAMFSKALGVVNFLVPSIIAHGFASGFSCLAWAAA